MGNLLALFKKIWNFNIRTNASVTRRLQKLLKQSREKLFKPTNLQADPRDRNGTAEIPGRPLVAPMEITSSVLYTQKHP
jgi:hypothetical protein